MVFLISTLEECFSFLDRIEPTVLFYGLVAFTWIVSIWEHYLSYRQYCNYKRHRDVPPELADMMTIQELAKARSYAIDKMRYDEIHSIFNEVETTILLLIDVLPWLWTVSGNILSKYDYNDHEILQSMVFVSILLIYSTITSIPWSYYYHFVLEEKHGFNKQTVAFFIKDTIKKLLLTFVLILPIFSLLIKIIQIGGDYFFVYAWLFITIMSLIIAIIYPNYIAPLFDRYDPLREGELRSSIERLAEKIQFPLAKIYVVEGSARSAHSNAYFYGFFKAKRIVLYDTLIKGYTLDKTKETKSNEATAIVEEDGSTLIRRQTNETTSASEKNKEKGCDSDEVLAVLCHEFGHWSLNHNLINLCISFINLFLVFAIFAALFKRTVLYEAFGFTKTHPILMGLLIIFQYVLSPYFEVFSFALTVLSRRFEFQADHFAVKLNHGDPLGRALKKLEMDNMSYPFSDHLYAKYHYSHPTLLERLKAIESMKKRIKIVDSLEMYDEYILTLFFTNKSIEMHSDDENDANRQLKVEEFLDHSQSYMNDLPRIKRQLHEIDRLNKPDSYIEKLNELGMSVNQITEDLRDIEQSHSQLNEGERSKVDQQIQLLRMNVDQDVSDLNHLREEMTTEEYSPSADNQNVEQEEEPTNGLRQRPVRRNPLDNSYDFLGREMTYLQERMDEVAAVIAEHERKLSRIEYYKAVARNQVHHASSFVHDLVHNRYVTTASGALLGAGVGGPVGFMMGTKIGALVALSGSALGALSMNIMRQRMTETDESEENTPTAYSQAML